MEIILKPNEKQMEILTKVSEITGVDYDSKEWHQDITIESLLNALSDMLCEYHRLEEKIEENKVDAEEPDPYKEWRDNNGLI